MPSPSPRLLFQLIPLGLRTEHFNLCSMRCTSCFLILNKWNGTEHGYQHQHTYIHTRTRACEGRSRSFNYKHRVLPGVWHQHRHTHTETSIYIHISRCIYSGFLYNVMYILYNECNFTLPTP